MPARVWGAFTCVMGCPRCLAGPSGERLGGPNPLALPRRQHDPLAVQADDPYAVLGVTPAASAAEIKAAYRALVKQHHPDAGGDAARIVALNAAWEVLGDAERRRRHDGLRAASAAAAATGATPAAAAGRPGHRRARAADQDLHEWLCQVVDPIDRLLGQVIRPFPARLQDLAADPWDDRLMEAFCAFLEESRRRLERVESLYRSRPCPPGVQGFHLSLYHCLSQVQDAITELERYTLGYVDGYLRDGREMLREAAHRRSLLQEERRRLEL